jgi:hypothetical protein
MKPARVNSDAVLQEAGLAPRDGANCTNQPLQLTGTR